MKTCTQFTFTSSSSEPNQKHAVFEKKTTENENRSVHLYLLVIYAHLILCVWIILYY